MARFVETKTIKKGLFGTVLHSAVATRFSVTIVSTSEPEAQGGVLMRRTIYGVPGKFVETNFVFVRRGQAIPFGAIGAKPADDSPDELVVDYEVRTGSDA